MKLQSCKETYIKYFQCKFANYSIDAVNALRLGKCKSKEFKTNSILIDSYIGMLYRYEVFQSDLTYLYSVTVTHNDDNATTVALSVDGSLLASYSGTDDSEYIASSLSSQIDDTSTYSSEVSGSTLYIYSYDAGESYSNAPTIVTSGDIDTTYTSLENSEETLLDFWNCITNDEINGIIAHLKDILGLYSTTNNPSSTVQGNCFKCN